MITLIVTICMTLNPYMCSEVQMVPEGYSAITSPMQCIMGGAVGGTLLVKDHHKYFVKGWRCTMTAPKETDISDWVTAEKERLRRAEPQIK